MSLADLKEGLTDRRKVELWLDHIGETDTACRDEVLQQCADNRHARAYFVNRYEQDCNGLA